MEQNTRNRRSFSNEESYDQDQNRYNRGGYGNNWGSNSDNDNDWNRNRNYGNSGRSNYGQDYGGYGNSRMNQDRDYDRWSDDRNSNMGNRTYENYGRTGSYSDWDFQSGGNRSRDFDTFGRDYNSNRGVNYGEMYDSGNDYERGSYGQGSSNLRRGNYDDRYGSQDYGRFNWSQDYGRNRNRDWDRDDRNDRSWWDKTRDEVASWFGDDDAERRRRMDERREGNYRGRGPKNYTRSSDRIKEDVSDRLSDAWDIDASDIDVEINGNEVTLTGTVPSKQQKRRAEDIAESVSGVNNVQNNLRVKQHEFNQSRDWGNDRGYSSGGTYSGSNISSGSTSSGSTTGTTSGSTTGSSSTGTGTSGSTSNQVKIEK